MSLPKVAVIGSCVSRDVFNSRFMPNYRDRVEVIDTLYQSALPSIVRNSDIDAELSDEVRPNFLSVMKKELLGKKLARLAALHPDVVVIDFFADVHFGVTTVDDQYVTRNHMAFKTLESADQYYDDRSATSPRRMRFRRDADGREYREVAKDSIDMFGYILKEVSPETAIVLNSARFSTAYTAEGGELAQFDNNERLLEKNDNWAELDDLFIDATGCEQIKPQSSDLVGSVGHPWGLHPVHYAQGYYDNLWRALVKVISDKGNA